MPKSVDRTIVIAAPPARVWKAWVEEMNAWWTMPYYNDHALAAGLLMEPRLGGRYIEKWGENGEGFLVGIITQWLPPRRLAYTWTEADWGGVQTMVRIDLEADGNGGTRFRFRHEGFEHLPPELQSTPTGVDLAEGYDGGWQELSVRLKSYIERGTPV